jgi:hypothetical protein
MKVKRSKLLAPEINGSVKGSQLVLVTKNGQTYARSRTTPRNPKSQQQVGTRDVFGSAAKAWQLLSAAQRAAWDKYAEKWFGATEDKAGLSGMAVYRKACAGRGLLGLPVPADAPLAGPPGPLASVTAESVAVPDEFRFRLVHGLAPHADYAVQVRITPGTGSPARKPRPCDLRAIRGVGAASSATLVASGDSVVFQGARFSVANGERYGYEIHVVRTADGMTSAIIAGEATREVR